jgi:hypothetical protein
MASLEQREKDNLLNMLLPVLAARGVARGWASSKTPYSDLEQECIAIASNPDAARDIVGYLRANPVLRLSVHAFLAHLSVAANVKPEHIPTEQHVLLPAGSRLARWLPTFLVVDGPPGRFLRGPDSPLSVLLRSEHSAYPTLAQARDTFNSDLFRRVRNGVGHWAIAWDEVDQQLVCFDWQSGERTVAISLLEGEALHVTSLVVIECLDRRVFELADI